MALETLTGTVYIDALDSDNPESGDSRAQGDDHLRGIKNVLLLSFPAITGAVTATQDELNILDGATVTVTELNYLAGKTHSSTNAVIDVFEGTADAGGNATTMLFRSSTAPTGWVKNTTNFDGYALRVITGTIGTHSSGSDMDVIFGSGKTTGNESSHTHAISLTSGVPSATAGYASGPNNAGTGTHTHSVSGTSAAGSAHNHSLSLDLNYVDVIFAIKA